jgi:hypothetical protein
MGLNIDKFNEMIDKASKIVSCDADCQRAKQKERLKRRFERARANVQTAPDQLNLATKQYFAFSNGAPMYAKITTDELMQKAKLLSAEIANNFLSEVDATMNNIQDYTSALNDAKLANEYNKELIKQIIQLQNVLYNAINGAVTNNRKSYYESESLANLRKWNYLFKIVFYVIVVALSLSFVLVPNSISTGKKIGISIALFTYPFYILYIAKFVLRIYNSILNVLPKNIYNNI